MFKLFTYFHINKLLTTKAITTETLSTLIIIARTASRHQENISYMLNYMKGKAFCIRLMCTVHRTLI